MAIARWKDWEGQGLDHCEYRQDKNGITLEGIVAGTRHGLYGGHYFVHTDTEYRTRLVRVKYVGGPCLHIQSDGEGHWIDMMDNRSLPDLDGCLDVDIGITPATNTLPIKRLKLAQKESQELTVAYVPLPDQIEDTFLPNSAAQRYTCLVPNQHYLYEGLFRSFSAELYVDEDGLVLDYPDTFKRVI